MKFIASINAFLVEEIDVKNGVLYIEKIEGPNLEKPKFIAAEDVQKICKKVVFGDKVTEIPEDAFYLWNIEEVEFGKNTTSVGKSAFDACLLKKVNTANLTFIAEDAFANNENLQEVYIGKALKKMSGNSFAHNTSLKKVVIDPKNTSLSKIPSFCFRDDSALETIENLNNITLDTYAFSGCKSLKVTLPQQTIIKNGQYSILNFKTEFSFDKGAEITILVDDYNNDLRTVVEKLKDKGIVVSAIPVSKKAVKQLSPSSQSQEEAELIKARKRLEKISSEIPKLNEDIFKLQTKLNNMPATQPEPVELGKTSIKL